MERVTENARTHREALDRHLGVLQDSLSCVSQAVWIPGRPVLGPEDQVAIGIDQPLKLQSKHGSQWIVLRASQVFHFELRRHFPRDWKVATDGYIYEVAESSGPPLFGWHYHPDSRPDCHFHVYSSVGPLNLHHAHLPTARVAFEEVLIFLLQDLEMAARRDDWPERLASNLGRHVRHRTWAGAGRPLERDELA